MSVGQKVGSAVKTVLFWLIVPVCFAVAAFFGKFLIIVIPLVICVLVLIASRRYVSLTRLKTDTIGELKNDGVVKLHGKVMSRQAFQSPLKQKSCIGYHYKVEDISTDDEGHSSYATVSAEDKCYDFTLSDYTGSIYVRSANLSLSLLKPQMETRGNRRHSEKCFESGQQLTVVGFAVYNSSSFKYELEGKGKSSFFVADAAAADKVKNALKMLTRFLPFGLLIYAAVCYFLLYYKPVHPHEEKTAFTMFAFFGMPILFIILAVFSRKNDATAGFFGILAAICILTLLISFPLMICLYMFNTPHETIQWIWLSILTGITLFFMIFPKQFQENNTSQD